MDDTNFRVIHCRGKCFGPGKDKVVMEPRPPSHVWKHLDGPWMYCSLTYMCPKCSSVIVAHERVVT